MPGCCETGRNVQKYRGGGGGGTASTLQEALENSNVATIDINLISGAKFRGDGSGLTNIPINGGNLNLQQVTNQDNQTTNEIIITNTGSTSLQTAGGITAAGAISGSTFSGQGSGLTTLNASNLTSGTVPLARGGTGQTTATAAATALGLGTGDSPQFTGVNIGHASDTTITRINPGVIAVEGQTVRTGDVALGTETSGDYVSTITGGDGIASTGTTSGETIAHSLSVDSKSYGGLAIESGKLALKLDDSSITGILSTGDGGTGSSISSVAKSDLLVGANGGGSFTKLSIPGSSYDGLVLKINASGELTWGTDLSNSGFNGDIADYITHTGDTDTKFGFPDVDKFIINTAGSERLTIFNNGNIGINQTNPQYKLDVDGDINLTGDLRINGVAQTFGGGGSGGSSAWTTSGSDVYRASGKVGIGKTNPVQELDVNGTINATNTNIENNLYVGGVITSPAGGSMEIDKMTVRSLNIKNMTVVAERPPKNISLN